jgi:hypothetical protein
MDEHAFTFAGLELLQASGLDGFPQDFRGGMAAYQASIARGFAFIQQHWVNAKDFP